MKWEIVYTKEACKDLREIDNSARIPIMKAIRKVSENPLPRPDGYGKPLGNRAGGNLSGFMRIKLRSLGYRVIYTLEKSENRMLIIIISLREDNEVYKAAQKRISEMIQKP